MVRIVALFNLIFICTYNLIGQTACTLTGSGNSISAQVTSNPSITGTVTGGFVTFTATGTTFTLGTALYGLAFDNSTANTTTYSTGNTTVGVTWSSTPTSLITVTHNAPNGTTITMDYSIDLGSSTRTGSCSLTTPLPVTLLNFQAQAQSKTTVLNWQTASEKDNAGFNIQRSGEGKIFQNIGFVKGQGTTNEKQSYVFTDEAPLSISYYRLLQKDFDGKESYSKVVSVLAQVKSSYRIYPNPASDVLNIQYNTEKAQNLDVEMYDSLGKQVHQAHFTAQEGDNRLFFNTKHLSKGFYTLKIKQESGVISEKVMIQ